MKIEIKTENLETLVSGLNNALIAYNDYVRMNFFFGLEKDNLPPKWYNLTIEEIDKRLEALHNLYSQLLKIEKENK